MDLRYNEYALTKSKYYMPSTKIKKKTLYVAPALPDGWIKQIDSIGHWMHCIIINQQLPKQGWKIHISTTINDAQKTLDIVSKELIKQNVQFKYVASRWEYYNKNLKYADRGSSGKFITIYPQNEDEFIRLLDILDLLLCDTEKGPYILNDKRWKEHNVYFRYGAFLKMLIPDEFNEKMAIRDECGNYVDDYRGPSYKIPDFITEPQKIIDMDNDRDALAIEKTPLEDYAIQSALHFSNGGGVYLAKCKGTENKVVLKEGRPGAGLDGRKRDAIQRIHQEGKMLKRLMKSPYVVDYINEFKAWEHVFLVEEYIDGSTLNTWIALNYPFVQKSKKEIGYCQKAISIIRGIKKAVEDIHSYGIGMGDLQIMNVMVDKNLQVKLIDFEAADDLHNIDLAGLETPGFSSKYAKTREQQDWFGLLKIAYYLFIPVGPVSDLSVGVWNKHDMWIEKQFGENALQLINEIKNCCQTHITIKRYKGDNYKKWYTISDIQLITEKLRNGIIADLKKTQQLLPGDIRQYTNKGGMINPLTGGFGVVMALMQTGEVPDVAKEWAIEHCSDKYLKNLPNGLFTGKAGIAGIVYSLGYVERAKQIFDSIIIPIDTKDISLLSGLSGIGLSLLSASMLPGLAYLKDRAIIIAKYLKVLLEENIIVKTKDVDFIPMGLIDGWAGGSLFFSALYKSTKNEEWLTLAVKTLEKELENCESDEDDILQIRDGSRLMPYLSGGISGVGIAILEIQSALNDIEKWSTELEKITGILRTRCTYNGGLFRGIFGLMPLISAFEKKHGKTINKEELFESINIYLIESKYDCCYFPGDYSFRLSGDVFSGSAGVLLALIGLQKKKWQTWLPLEQNQGLSFWD